MINLLISMVASFLFLVNQANFLFGYKVITTIIALVTTKKKSLCMYQQNWMLVFPATDSSEFEKKKKSISGSIKNKKTFFGQQKF